MRNLLLFQINRYAVQSHTAFYNRDSGALHLILEQMEAFTDVGDAAHSWSLVKSLTRARYDFLSGNFKTSHIDTLNSYADHSETSDALNLQVHEDLVTYELHSGDLTVALKHLEVLAALFLSQGLREKALESKLKLLHLIFVFESVLKANPNENLRAFEDLYIEARRYKCAGVETACALFISKEYSRRHQYILALSWADKAVDGHLLQEAVQNQHLEIAFIHRSEVYRSMGLSAASAMDIEASRLVKM